jgi:hypothetical protein
MESQKTGKPHSRKQKKKPKKQTETEYQNRTKKKTGRAIMGRGPYPSAHGQSLLTRARGRSIRISLSRIEWSMGI